MIAQIGACYFPTTIFVIDDSRRYLSGLIMDIDAEKAFPIFHHDPKEAVQFLLEQYQSNPYIKQCSSIIKENPLDRESIEISIRSIAEQIYNPNRFNEISLAIIDYLMPSMDGLVVCQQLKNSVFKKIMVTGVANEDIVIKAYNDDLIDKFVQKDNIDFSTALNEAINELQQQYFLGLSQTLISVLTDESGPFKTWLDEPNFITLFNQIYEENKITEYYLMDSSGSLMLLDNKGKLFWLIVRNEEEMQTAFGVAERVDGFPVDLLNTMRNKEGIFYTNDESEISDDPEKLKKYFHPATQLIGRKTNYYYSFIKDLSAYDIQQNKIISFETYQKLKRK